MPLIRCDKCNGTGKVEFEEDLSLAKLLIMLGEKLEKRETDIPRLPAIEVQEAFPEIVRKIHGEE
jgi:hypothetical protein